MAVLKIKSKDGEITTIRTEQFKSGEFTAIHVIVNDDRRLQSNKLTDERTFHTQVRLLVNARMDKVIQDESTPLAECMS